MPAKTRATTPLILDAHTHSTGPGPVDWPPPPIPVATGPVLAAQECHCDCTSLPQKSRSVANWARRRSRAASARGARTSAAGEPVLVATDWWPWAVASVMA